MQNVARCIYTDLNEKAPSKIGYKNVDISHFGAKITFGAINIPYAHQRMRFCLQVNEMALFKAFSNDIITPKALFDVLQM